MEINDPLVAKIFEALKPESATTGEKADAIRRANGLIGLYGARVVESPLDLLLSAPAPASLVP